MNISFSQKQGESNEKPKQTQSGGGMGIRNQGFGSPSFRKPIMQTRESLLKKEDDSLTNKIIDNIVRASIYLTIFLLPLFFAPNVPSVLELNKQVLLVVFVGAGFLVWVGKMAWKNEIRFKKNFILVPVVTFLAVLGLSTAFSSYVEQSMWGGFGSEGKSFITALFFGALFLLIFNTVKTRGEALKVLLVFLSGGFLLALYGILQIWGIFLLPIDLTKAQFFNTIGSVYIYSAYVGALFLLTLALFLSDVSKILKIVLIALSFFFFFVLMVVNFKIIWIGLIICIALLFGITIMKGDAAKSQSRVLPMIFLVLTLLMILRKQPIVKKELPVEILLDYKSSIQIALDSFKENPLLGSGPVTFSNVYQHSRPDNLGDFWAVNFNDGRSYFLTLMATTGILGALSFLFLVVAGLVYLFKTMVRSVSKKAKGSKDYIAVGIGIVWLFITFILLAYLANISLLLLWWFSLALFLSFTLLDPAVENKEFVSTSATPKSSLAFSFLFVLVIIGFVAAIYLQSQKYIAAVYFSKALAADAKGDDIQLVADRIGKAVQFDPNRDIYYRNLSVAMFALANKKVSESKNEELSSEDMSYVSNMIRASIGAAEKAKALDPKNPENHLAVARIYEGILVTMEGADERAIKSYQDAIDLDDSNPSLYQRLASVYVALSDLEVAKSKAENPTAKNADLPEESLKNLALAKDSLEKGLKVKPDFASANLLLAGIYEREGNLDKAIEKEKENKKTYSKSPAVAFRLGLLYYKGEQFDNAKKEFEEAVALDKEYANALYFLGLVLDRQGDKKGAIEKFEKVSKSNPENEDVKKIIDNLKNGKGALDGLAKAESPNAPTENQPAPAQPSVNPSVEPQEIPEEATPTIEEVDQPNEENPAQ